MPRGNYNTRQRERILEILRGLGDRHVTVDEVAYLSRAQGEEVGKTTIYRYLEALAEKGQARKYMAAPGACACYQYLADAPACHEHYHLQCVDCGRLFHVDCARLDEIARHIEAEHGFVLDNTKTVFMGVCESCRGGGKDGADDAP